MSEYLHVFARKDDIFIELLWKNRNDPFYQALKDYAPYEAIHALNSNIINNIVEDLNDDIVDNENRIASIEKLINSIKGMNNSCEEKMEAIEGYYRRIDEIENYIKDIRTVLIELYFLKHMVDNTEENIYIGIECGSNVTVDDIE